MTPDSDFPWLTIPGAPGIQSTPEPAELRLQSDCFLWHWNTFPEERGMLFHVQNKARNRIEGAKFKAIGVVRGVSDLIYVLPQGRSLYVEMKTSTGRQSKDQEEWQAKVQARGHIYLICRSLAEFQNIVTTYLPHLNYRP